MEVRLTGGTVVLPDRVLAHHTVVVIDGRIATIVPDDQGPTSPNAEVVDISGRYVGPGFVDIHCHGGAGRWVWDDPVAATEHHLAHGTTSMLATTALLESHEANVAAVAAIAAAVRQGRVRTVRGIHMEGPYLNPDFGAFRELSMAPSADQYLDFPDAAGGLLRTMTIAPELDGVARMVNDLQRATGGAMVFSVGHSRATLAQIEALVPAGLRLATHLMNATGAEATRFAGTREMGVDEAVLADDGIWAEVIADADGVHVRPDMLRLVVQVKGIDRVVVVTDCAAAQPSPGDDLSYNDRGELAGSALTMDRAVGNLARHARLPLHVAWRMASHNPAAALGMLGEVGQLLPGRRADLVVARYDGTDADLAVDQVWLGGVPVRQGDTP